MAPLKIDPWDPRFIKSTSIPLEHVFALCKYPDNIIPACDALVDCPRLLKDSNLEIADVRHSQIENSLCCRWEIDYKIAKTDKVFATVPYYVNTCNNLKSLSLDASDKNQKYVIDNYKLTYEVKDFLEMAVYQKRCQIKLTQKKYRDNIERMLSCF